LFSLSAPAAAKTWSILVDTLVTLLLVQSLLLLQSLDDLATAVVGLSSTVDAITLLQTRLPSSRSLHNYGYISQPQQHFGQDADS
jgi:hypothetical protein